MSSPLRDLEPALLWQHFDDIRQIPRPSKHEERIAAHVQDWADRRGFEVRRDEAGSMVVRVPATPGHEGSETVVLQGHLDMVCEKNSDVEHDFMTQGIEVEVNGDWVTARGTTLGADNGIGLAAAMALADDPEVVHGPLEILATVDEETGLTGAKQLDPSLLSGKILLNLDTEEDGALYMGCAGGADTDAFLPTSRRRGLLGSVPVKLSVRGLRGGHSGLNIIENRGNAIKLATRVLQAALYAGVDLDVVSIDGGSKHNAIPRECFALIRLDADAVDQLRDIAASCAVDFAEEFGATDPDLEVVVESLEDDDTLRNVVNVHTRDRLLRLLDGLPHGVLAMSREVPGLVETSTNLAVVETQEDGLKFVTSHRSSVMPALYAVRRSVTSTFRQAGAKVSYEEPYPGWKPNPGSPILNRAAQVYERLFGHKPEIKAIHAGLECGLILEKVPGMDAVSLGPQIENAHSPDERVQISSVAKFYKHVAALLEDLA
ncbi:MAG TPA: aminoacyl-histidine dipeptidase [Candidatus Sulfomarinibacteraceae bacterium]|nr:aminoacyl-histidine dipeptidase [Candidatus Sulfomarinibacteraceae bacterium]